MKPRQPRVCVECGKSILSPGGTRTVTCSEPCRVARLKRLKHASYERRKQTPEFKVAQAEYVASIKSRRAQDPAFDAAQAEQHRRNVKNSVERRNADPERRAMHLQKMREWRRLATPEQREKFLTASREWYAGLSAEERARLIAGKVEKRRQQRAAAAGPAQ
ncbi:hypothetical protein [Diaphorobacter sp.]|uniref:hypothetical protein n=1 Tax=Diaphorobacter sp. TaxID=1934310 RepID=UPI0025853931|nr:hypothetical protein [Diaphorobacter sp.]